MHITLRRHLGKVLAGAAIAVTGTAVMIGITLPGPADAAGNGKDGRNGSGSTAAGAADGADGTAKGAQANAHPGTVEAAPVQGKKGFGRDPLTGAELDRIKSLVLGPAGQSGLAAENARGGKGAQWLTTDLAELRPEDVSKAGAPRRAQITSYDYKTDSLRTAVVNLDTGKIESTDVQKGVQPPIARDEAVEAVKLLIAAPQGEGLRKDYKDATGRKLTKPEQLALQNAMIYRVGAENPGPAALKDCGKHRCARLFLKVKNGPWIDVRSLIVDLSARTVHKL